MVFLLRRRRPWGKVRSVAVASSAAPLRPRPPPSQRLISAPRTPPALWRSASEADRQSAGGVRGADIRRCDGGGRGRSGAADEATATERTFPHGLLLLKRNTMLHQIRHQSRISSS